MVRSSTYRTSKYSAKLVGDVWKNRIDAQRDSMVAQVGTRFADLEATEVAAKNLLTGWGVSVIFIPSYLSFARECHGIMIRHSGTIAHDEICIAHDKWETRGLDSYYMQVIAMDVFAVDISDCT